MTNFAAHSMYDRPALPLPRGLQKNKKIKTSIGNPTKFPISNRSRGSLGMWYKISLFISHGVDCTTPTVFLTSPRPLGEVQNSSFFTKRGWSCYLLLKGFPELPKLSRPLANRKQDIQVCHAGNLAFSYLTEEARGKLGKGALAAPASSQDALVPRMDTAAYNLLEHQSQETWPCLLASTVTALMCCT